jgi:hypothetical protein
MILNNFYTKAFSFTPLLSAVAYAAAYFVLPGIENNYLSTLIPIFSGIYLIIFLLGYVFNPISSFLFYIRIICDSLLSLIVFVLNKDILSLYLLLFVILWINSNVTWVYKVSTKQKKFLKWHFRVFSILLLLFGIFLPYYYKTPIWAFPIFINILFFVIVTILASVSTHREREIDRIVKKFDLYSINNKQISHDIRNVLQYISLTEKESVVGNNMLDRLNSVVGLIDSLQIFEIEVHDILLSIQQMSHFKNLKIDLRDNFNVHVNKNNIVNLMLNLINNAAEAGASLITISSGKHSLIITDDGPGFDTSSISSGYTTKSHGTGQTLSNILPKICSYYNISHKIKSSSSGTKIIFNFARNIKFKELINE